MTDNTDLLGGDLAPSIAVADKLAAETAAPKKRGRSAKVKNAIIVATDLGKAEGDHDATVTAEVLPNGALKVLDVAIVPASTNPEQRDAAEKPAEGTLEAFLQGIDPEVAKRLAPDPIEDTSKFDEFQSFAEPDGSVSLQLPELSVDYTLALAKRVQVFGEHKRTYAYQRVLRAGKKL